MFTTHTLLGQKKYLAREKALVIDTRDPGLSGRIRVNCRTLGDSNWIPYIMSPGFFTPPKVGDWVYVECEDGIEWSSVAHGKAVNLVVDLNNAPNSIYREVPTVTAWTSNGSLNENGQVSNNFGVAGFKGHAILLDDGQEVYGIAPSNNQNAGIKIFSFGGSKIILSDDTANQKILIADSGNTSTPTNFNTTSGNRIVIDPISSLISIRNNSNTTYITIGTNDINIVTENGNCNITTSGKTTINASEVDIISSGKTVVTANEADVTAPNVNVLASAGVNMTTPLLNVTGVISCSGIAAGGASPVAGQAIVHGPIMATGNISSGSDISDSIGTLSGFRTHYNEHTHVAPSGGGTTTTPTPTDP